MQNDINIESTPNLLKRRLSRSIPIINDIALFDNNNNAEFSNNEISNSFLSHKSDLTLYKNHNESDIILDENDCDKINNLLEDSTESKYDQNNNIEERLQIEIKKNIETNNNLINSDI